MAINESILRSIFIALFILMLLIQVYFGRKHWERSERAFWLEKRALRREGRLILISHTVLFFLMMGFFVFYVIDPKSMPAFAVHSPRWLRWTGAALGALCIPSLIAVHQVLGRYWSPYLKLRKDHALVTSGVYRWVRHPMYTVLFAFMIALGLVSANWVFTLLFAARIVLIYARVGKEEMMMIEQFGDEYRNYMQRTGRLLPRF